MHNSISQPLIIEEPYLTRQQKKENCIQIIVYIALSLFFIILFFVFVCKVELINGGIS